LAASELSVEEICQKANDKDNLFASHKRCWRGRDEIQKFIRAQENPSPASSIGGTDTNTQPDAPVSS
jgi:hypothetical protein